MTNADDKPEDGDGADTARRAFLRSAGRLAALTPPAVTLLLHTSMTSTAVASSGGKPGGPPGGGPPGGGPPSKWRRMRRWRRRRRFFR